MKKFLTLAYIFIVLSSDLHDLLGYATSESLNAFGQTSVKIYKHTNDIVGEDNTYIMANWTVKSSLISYVHNFVSVVSNLELWTQFHIWRLPTYQGSMCRISVFESFHHSSSSKEEFKKYNGQSLYYTMIKYSIDTLYLFKQVTSF